jgi:hypothetical protein
MELKTGIHFYGYLDYTEYYSGSSHSGYLGSDTTYSTIETLDEYFTQYNNNEFICNISGNYTITLGYKGSNAGSTSGSYAYIWLNDDKLLTVVAKTESITKILQVKTTNQFLNKGDILKLQGYSGSWVTGWYSIQVEV